MGRHVWRYPNTSTILIMTIFITPNTGDITYTDITNNWFYLWITSLLTVYKNTYVMYYLLML
jgi:hypothetical protein